MKTRLTKLFLITLALAGASVSIATEKFDLAVSCRPGPNPSPVRNLYFILREVPSGIKMVAGSLMVSTGGKPDPGLAILQKTPSVRLNLQEINVRAGNAINGGELSVSKNGRVPFYTGFVHVWKNRSMVYLGPVTCFTQTIHSVGGRVIR